MNTVDLDNEYQQLLNMTLSTDEYYETHYQVCLQ
jgi:hypothetical protein